MRVGTDAAGRRSRPARPRQPALDVVRGIRYPIEIVLVDPRSYVEVFLLCAAWIRMPTNALICRLRHRTRFG